MTLHLALVNGRIVPKPVTTAHLSAERLAAFLDERLTAEERAQAIAHFAACTDCRRELTALRQTFHSVTSATAKRWLAAGATLAAVLAFALVLPRVRGTDDGGSGSTSEVRGVRGVDGAASIAISRPKNGDSIRLPLTLTWQSAGTQASYLLVVMDSVGSEMLRLTRADTSITLPDSIRLVPGARYYWSVEAKLIDGRSAKTGVHSFRIR